MVSAESSKNVEIYTVSPEPASQKVDQKKTFWTIDTEMIRFKLHYFVFLAALGCSAPYLPVFAKNRVGLSATSLSVVLSTQRALFVFTKLLMGYLADYFNKLKVIICALVIIQIVFFFLLLAVPKIQTENKIQIVNPSQNHIDYSYSINFHVECDPFINDSNSERDMYANNGTDNSCLLPFEAISSFLDECLGNTTGRKDMFLRKSDRKSTVDLQILKEEENFIAVSKTSKSSLSSKCKLCCNITGHCKNIKCSLPKYYSKSQSSDAKEKSQFQTFQFWLYALFTTVGMASANSLITLSDTACCESLQKTGSDFGRQRLWGAIGWGLMSPIGGLLNDYTNDYIAAWILMACLYFVTLYNIAKLDLIKPQFSKNILKDVGTIMRSKEFLVFMTGAFLSGIGTGIVWFYLVWFLTSIGGSRFLFGMVNFIQCAFGEIPFMFYSGWMIKKVGHFNVLSLALLAYAIRFFWYSQLQNPWLVLPVECVHGLTFGIFYPAVASFAKMSAKPGTETTTQAILFTTHEGLGCAFGCIIAGIGFDTFGGHQTFFYVGVFSGCGMLLSIILHLCVRQQTGVLHVTSSTDS